MTEGQLPIDEHGGKLYIWPGGWAEQPALPVDEEPGEVEEA